MITSPTCMLFIFRIWSCSSFLLQVCLFFCWSEPHSSLGGPFHHTMLLQQHFMLSGIGPVLIGTAVTTNQHGPHCSTRSCVRLPPTQGWNGSPHHHRSAEWPKQDLLVTVSLQNGQNRTFMSPSFCRMHFHQAWHNRIVDARATNVASFCLISWNCWRITLIPTLELRLCFSWTQADFITWAATSKPMGLFCSMTSWWKQTGWVSGCSIISQCSFFRVMSMGFPLF